jgi:hypothetical protein
MPSKWHVRKDTHADSKKDNATACLCFLKYLAFQVSSSDGARLRLVAIDGVPFAVLKGRAQQKRHRPPHDKTSELSFDTAM